MRRRSGGLSRRRFLASTLTAGALSSPSAVVRAQETVSAARDQRAQLAIDALGLDPATRADLEAFAQPVLREAAWLAELPLDTVNPAFRFAPGEGER